MNIHNVVIVITGAGKKDADGKPRIGNALAKHLASQGAKILIHYASSANDALATVDEIHHNGGDAVAFQADLSDSDSGARILQKAREYFGQSVQVLINAAALFPTDDILTCSAESLVQSMSIMTISPVLAMQALAKDLPDHMSGVIVNIIDARIGTKPYHDHYSYSLAKAALLEATKVAAVQLASRNIRVVSISPGAILQAAGKSKDHHTQVVQAVPLGREGGTESIIKAVISLIDNDFITGTNTVVDGGMTLT